MIVTCPKCGATITLSPMEQINGCPMCGHGRRQITVTNTLTGTGGEKQ